MHIKPIFLIFCSLSLRRAPLARRAEFTFLQFYVRLSYHIPAFSRKPKLAYPQSLGENFGRSTSQSCAAKMAAFPVSAMHRQDGGVPSQRHARSHDWDSRLPGSGYLNEMNRPLGTKSS
jgi:hypothetical protein